MLALVDSMTGDHPARPVLVLSNDPAAAGLTRAAARAIPVAAVDHRPFKGDRAGFDAALLEPLLAVKPDIICLAGFMRILTPDFVARFRGRMLNIHPSLLPKYPGLGSMKYNKVTLRRTSSSNPSSAVLGHGSGVLPRFHGRLG